MLLFSLLVNHAVKKRLVLAMLPPRVADTLERGHTYCEAFEQVTILFADIVQYTDISTQTAPTEVRAQAEEAESWGC